MSRRATSPEQRIVTLPPGTELGYGYRLERGVDVEVRSTGGRPEGWLAVAPLPDRYHATGEGLGADAAVDDCRREIGRHIEHVAREYRQARRSWAETLAIVAIPEFAEVGR